MVLFAIVVLASVLKLRSEWNMLKTNSYKEYRLEGRLRPARQADGARSRARLMSTIDCAKSGALFSALRCGDCPHLTIMSEIHHCGALLVDLSVRVGGLSRDEVAVALGLEKHQVRDAEDSAMRKVERRRLALLEAA